MIELMRWAVVCFAFGWFVMSFIALVYYLAFQESQARVKRLEEACRDVESKIVDYEAGRINWRPDDFLYRVRNAIGNAR